MSTLRHHARNTAGLLFSAVVAKVLFLLATVRCFKALSVEANGNLQLAYIVGTTVMILSEVGLRGYLIRELSRRRADVEEARRFFSSVFWCRIAAGVIALGLGTAAMSLTGYSNAVVWLTVAFLAYGFFDSLNTLLKAAIRTYERMEFEAVFTLVGRGTVLALIVFFGQSDSLTLAEIGLAHIAGGVVETLFLLGAIRAFLPLRFGWRGAIADVVSVLRRSLPFAVLALVGLVYLRTGTIVLSRMAGEEAVSFYNTASKIPEALNFLPLAFVNALIPYLSRCHGDTALLRRYGTILVRYLGFAGVAVGCVFILETRWVVLLISKADYLPAIPVFRVFGAYVFLSAMQYVLANLLICMNAERRVVQRFAFCLVLNVVLNLLLVPRWGALGAALALVAGEASATVIDSVLLWRRGVRLPVRLVAEFAVFAAAVGGAMLLVPTDNAWLRVGAGAAVAAGLAGAMALSADRAVVRGLLRP